MLEHTRPLCRILVTNIYSHTYGANIQTSSSRKMQKVMPGKRVRYNMVHLTFYSSCFILSLFFLVGGVFRIIKLGLFCN